MAEAKQHMKSGEHPELEAQKEAAKSQEKASTAAAKGHATDVSDPPPPLPEIVLNTFLIAPTLRKSYLHEIGSLTEIKAIFCMEDCWCPCFAFALVLLLSFSIL